ncbi:MAG: hypothetical protein GKR86_00070 [Ilumatobacter sp.]|nr:hypothetical protein [Ilumatobacter sp.]
MGDLTTNYEFQKPTFGADDTTWGDDYSSGNPLTDPSPGLNGNWEKIDQVLQAQKDAIDAIEAVLDDLPNQIDAARIPVGALYVTLDGTDPNTALGYGTWVAWGTGRALASEGFNGEGSYSNGQERGSETHTLTWSQMGFHSHGINPPNTGSSAAGGHSHLYTGILGTVTGDQESGTRGVPTTRSTGGAGAHSHTLNIPAFTSGSAGSGAAHNNIMPSKAAYIWRRTA